MKIDRKYVDKNSRARLIGAVSLALFLLLMVWLASLVVVASLSVAQAPSHAILLVGIASQESSTLYRMGCHGTTLLADHVPVAGASAISAAVGNVK